MKELEVSKMSNEQLIDNFWYYIEQGFHIKNDILAMSNNREAISFLKTEILGRLEDRIVLKKNLQLLLNAAVKTP